MVYLMPDIIERPSWRLILDLERGLIPERARDTLMSMALEPAITSILAATPTPILSTVVGLADKVINIIGGILKMNRDDQICYYAATFADKFDNLGVGQHRHTKSNEVEFNYEILAG